MILKYYSLKNILERKAIYNVIIGLRSNGKTFSVLEYGIKKYVSDGKQFAIVRRWQDDFRGKRAATMFDGIVTTGLISKITNGEWTGVYYYSGRWYLSRVDENMKPIVSEIPFCYAFAISATEHDKSTSYPNIDTILFDEFITRNSYLPDEFILFMNTISTIVRNRNDVKIFMCANTINKYCPYFTEMGLKNVEKMKPGTIDVYTYGNSDLRVAVEYCDNQNKNKPSDVYFAFDNPKLSMITGGDWEIAVYPHKPCDFRPKDIKFIYFIKFGSAVLQCEIISFEDKNFTFIHKKTGEIKNPNTDLIFCPEYDPRPNWRRKITMPILPIEQKIAFYYKCDKIFYQSNEIGEIVRNYLMWCTS